MRFRRILSIIGYKVCFNSTLRANYVRRFQIFGAIGTNVFLPRMILPLRCEHIFLHNNIEIASGVKLVPHDAIHGVFNRMDNTNVYKEHIGDIIVYDNVFIGTNTIILGPCTIGPNAIIAAGSVVCKDVPPGSVVGGCPAVVIGDFNNLKQKRKYYN